MPQRRTVHPRSLGTSTSPLLIDRRFAWPTALRVAAIGVACLAATYAFALRASADQTADQRAPGAESPAQPEVRALWVARTSLVSPGEVANIVRDAERYGFNTLLVQVRGRGDAFFNGSIEPRAEQLAGQPAAFDPLAELTAAAHAAGLEVHAWVNVALAASAASLPANRAHVVHTHPEWLMVPRALAQELAPTDPTEPAYVLRLSQWARANSRSVEGLFVSPIHDAAVAHTVAVVSDLVQRYPVDGIHLDYIRYPNDQFDYSRATLDAFREEMQPRLDADTRTRLDARRASTVTAYADAFPDAWMSFRRARLTRLVEQLADRVRRIRPQALLSAAVLPDPADATNVRLQDWPMWLQQGLIDVICPMIYTTSAQRFGTQTEAIQTAAAGRPVWAGIGAWRLSPTETVGRIRVARERRFGGIALFSYDSLANDRAGFLATVDRDAFQKTSAEVTSSR